MKRPAARLATSAALTVLAGKTCQYLFKQNQCRIGCKAMRLNGSMTTIAKEDHCPWADDKEWDQASHGVHRPYDGCPCYEA